MPVRRRQLVITWGPTSCHSVGCKSAGIIFEDSRPPRSRKRCRPLLTRHREPVKSHSERSLAETLQRPLSIEALANEMDWQPSH
jgi:hypothetical protein